MRLRIGSRLPDGLAAAALLLAAVLGCRPAAQPAPGAAGAPASAAPGDAAGAAVEPGGAATAAGPSDGTGPAGPTGPTGPAALGPLVREAAATEPSGATVWLPVGDEAVVDPGARFEVVLRAAFRDARLSLLDESDAVVEATASAEVGPTTRLTLTPSAPLVPAARYQLRVEGAVTRELHDDRGRAFLPAGFPVLVAGTAPAAPEHAAHPKRKKRH